MIECSVIDVILIPLIQNGIDITLEKIFSYPYAKMPFLKTLFKDLYSLFFAVVFNKAVYYKLIGSLCYDHAVRLEALFLVARYLS